MVEQLGEVGGAAVGGGEVGAGGDGAALAAAAAEVDRDQRQAVGGGERLGRRGERPGQAGERPAVGGDDRLVVAGVGEMGRADDAAADRPRQFPPRLHFAAARDRGDHRDEQQRDQRRQRRALDGRLTALSCRRAQPSPSRSPLRVHARR